MDLLLYLVAIFLPFQLYFNFGSIPLTIGYVLATVFILAEAIEIVLRGKLIIPKLIAPYALFLITIFLSYLGAVDYRNFFIKTSQIIFYAIFYIAVVNRVKTERQIQLLTKIILVTGAISGLLGIVQFAFAQLVGPDLITDLFFNRFGSIVFGIRGVQRIGSSDSIGFFYRSALPGIGTTFRAFGLFGGGNSFGFYHALLYALSLESITRRRGWWMSIQGAIPLILALSVFLSWSRTAWLMLVVASIIRAGRPRFNILVFAARTALVIALAIFFASLLPNAPIAKAISATVTRSDSSTIARLQTMEQSVQIWKQRFWTGSGLGNFPTSLSGNISSNATAHTAESLYLELLVEVGLFGLASFIILFLGIFQECSLLSRTHPPVLKMLGRSVRSMWIVVVVGFIFNAILTEPSTMLMWWLTVGLVSAGRIMHKYRKSARLHITDLSYQVKATT